MSPFRLMFELEKQCINEISKSQLMEFTEKISAQERLSGSAEELQAFNYVKTKFEEFGLLSEITFHQG
jgi:hypothetical protein